MIDLKPACRGMIDVLASVTDDQLDAPTPCLDYTVTDLIDHVHQVATGFAALARGDAAPEGEAGDADRADADPDPGFEPAGDRKRVAERVRLLGEAWSVPAAWEGSTDAGGVELSNAQWGRIALTEMVVHGWDLARSTGQRLEVPEQTLRACLEHVEVFVPNAPVPELWGSAVEVADDAPLLDRIVAITGRAP